MRPKTGFIRIEIKFRNKSKIRYILEHYNDKKLEQFENSSLELLVNFIDFITPQSKKNERRYKRQRSWRAFLGSDIKRIKWSQIFKEKYANRKKSDVETVNKGIRRALATVNNTVKRLRTIESEEEINKRLANGTGYSLIKQ